MKRAPSYRESVLIVLPTVWWAVGAVASSLYMGWNHDPRFFRLYRIPLTLFAWVSGGESYRPAEAVAVQDGLVAFLVSAALAAILVRSSAWREARPLRVGCALFSVLLPWQPFVATFDYPEWYAVAATTFATGYAVAVGTAFVAPVSRGMRGMLFGLALAGGVTLSMWRLERWEWLWAGSLIAAFGLLAYCLAQTLVWDERCRRTKG